MGRLRMGTVYVEEYEQGILIEAEPRDVAKTIFDNATPPEPIERGSRLSYNWAGFR